MKRKKNWVYILFIVLNILAVRIMVNSQEVKVNANANDNSLFTYLPTEDSNTSGLYNPETAISLGWNVYSITEENSIGLVHALYPVTNNSFVDDFIKQKIDKFKFEFNDKSETLAKLYIDYEVYTYDGNLVTILLNKSEHYVNDTKNSQSFSTYTFDMSKNKQINLKDIFTDTNYLNILSQKSKEKLQDSEMRDLIKIDGLEANENNFLNMAITNKELILFFNKNQVLPSEYGSQEIELPYTELVDILSMDTIYEKLNPPPVPPPPSSEGVKYIALTFDDGPSTDNTPRLLDALDKYNAKATFFLVGNRISSNAEIVKRMYDSGQQIGNHTFSHANLTELSNESFISEIAQTSNLINSITGSNPTLVRPPYGEFNAVVNDMCKSSGYAVMVWNVDTEDWKNKDVEMVYNHMANNVNDGDVILLHDIYQTSVDAAIRLLQDLSGKGYKFVTIDELCAIKNEAIECGVVYSNFN